MPSINRSNLDGPGLEVLLEELNSDIRGIALLVDPEIFSGVFDSGKTTEWSASFP